MSGLNLKLFTHPVHWKNLFRFVCAFILFTVIGALSHEAGHLVVAKMYGHQTNLHYASVDYYNKTLLDRQDDIYLANETAIKNDEDFPEKEEFQQVTEQLTRQGVWILLGGPIQTCLTGILGLMILLIRRRRQQLHGFAFTDWLAVFLSLFWLRQVANLAITLVEELLKPDGHFFGGDEYYVAATLQLHDATFALPLAVIGMLVSLFVVFKVIPIKTRWTFILAGLIGGIIGFVLWMIILGPILLP